LEKILGSVTSPAKQEISFPLREIFGYYFGLFDNVVAVAF
jgi:hypothetical protein